MESLFFNTNLLMETPMKNIRTALTLFLAAFSFLLAPSAYAKTDNNDVDVTLITHCCLGNPFWEPLLQGARDAAKAFNVKVDFQNADSDAAKNVNLIEQAIANKQNAIIPMLVHPDAMAKPLKKAMSMGITVIAANADSPKAQDAREAYVGAGFVASGEMIAKRIVAQHAIKAGSKCVVAGGKTEEGHIAARGEGVMKGLKAAGVEGEIIRGGDGAEEALNVITQYLLSHPKTACVISLASAPTEVAPKAIQEAGLKNIPNGGFDLTPRITENIKSGRTTASVDQQPYWQGFMPVMMAAMKVRYGLAPADFDTSAALVDKTNLEFVTKFTGKFR
jgi:simple sugar transport system substrate-binding protein